MPASPAPSRARRGPRGLMSRRRVERCPAVRSRLAAVDRLGADLLHIGPHGPPSTWSTSAPVGVGFHRARSSTCPSAVSATAACRSAAGLPVSRLGTTLLSRRPPPAAPSWPSRPRLAAVPAGVDRFADCFKSLWHRRRGGRRGALHQDATFLDHRADGHGRRTLVRDRGRRGGERLPLGAAGRARRRPLRSRSAELGGRRHRGGVATTTPRRARVPDLVPDRGGDRHDGGAARAAAAPARGQRVAGVPPRVHAPSRRAVGRGYPADDWVATRARPPLRGFGGPARSLGGPARRYPPAWPSAPPSSRSAGRRRSSSTTTSTAGCGPAPSSSSPPSTATSCPPPTPTSSRAGSPRAPTGATSSCTSRRSSTRSPSCRSRGDRAGRRRVRRGPRRRRRRLRRGAHGARAVPRAGPDASTRPSRRCSPGSTGPSGRRDIEIGLIVTAMRHAANSHRDRRGRPPPPRPGRRRVRHRRQRVRQPAVPPPRRLPQDRRGRLPHHDPRRRGVRPAVDLGGAADLRRRAARPRGAHRRRHHRRRRRPGPARPAGLVRPRPPGAAGDVPHVERPHRHRRHDRRAPDRPAHAGCASGSRSTPTTG